MGYGRKFDFINRLILSSILITFTITTFPIPCYSININPNDIQFSYRMQELIQKVYKAAEKEDSNKIIDLMLDVKREVEVYTGKSIDMDKSIDEIEKEIRGKGTKIPKKEFSTLKKMLKKKEKRYSHRLLHLENCFYENISYNIEEENLLFLTNFSAKGKEDSEIIIPIRLTVGVTVALVGLFIMVVPVIPPPLKGYGSQMVAYGVALAAEACYSSFDENQKKSRTLSKGYRNFTF